MKWIEAGTWSCAAEMKFKTGSQVSG